MNNQYPYLPEGRTIKYVSVENQFMKEAENMRNNFSTDSKFPTGSVVVLNNEIIGKSANKSSFKNKKIIKIHGNGICIRKFLKIKTGTKYFLCPGCAQFRHHSENRAIKDAIKKKKIINGADLYLYGHWWCCKPCWNKIIKAGIRDVYLVDNATKLFKK